MRVRVLLVLGRCGSIGAPADRSWRRSPTGEAWWTVTSRDLGGVDDVPHADEPVVLTGRGNGDPASSPPAHSLRQACTASAPDLRTDDRRRFPSWPSVLIMSNVARPAAVRRPDPGATPASRGPAVALPRPPGRWEVALHGFWQARAVPIDRARLGVAAAVGLLGGVALVGHRIGLGVSIVGLGILGTAVPGLVRRRALRDLLTLALAASLLVMVTVRAAEWVVALSLLGAAGAAAVALTSARRAAAVLLAPVLAVLGTLRAMVAVRGALGSLAGRRRESVLVALRSLAVTLVLVGVFGALFASADAVFAALMPRVDLGRVPGQVLVGLLVAGLAVGAAHLSLAPVPWPDASTVARRAVRPAEWLVPVLALDVVVSAFVLVQVGALLGGHRFVQRTAGLSYAAYAREGFGQLVVVTLLTLLVVAVAARRAPRATPGQDRAARAALAVLCVGTLAVVASAVRRMSLYVDAFGLTRLRITVLVAEVALGVVLLLVLAAGVSWRSAWLPAAVVQVSAVAVLGLALANPDALIVQHNTGIDGFVHGPAAVDLDYLRGLSADAVVAAASVDEPVRSAVLRGAGVPESDGWAGWNLGRALAAQVLAEEGQ